MYFPAFAAVNIVTAPTHEGMTILIWPGRLDTYPEWSNNDTRKPLKHSSTDKENAGRCTRRNASFPVAINCYNNSVTGWERSGDVRWSPAWRRAWFSDEQPIDTRVSVLCNWMTVYYRHINPPHRHAHSHATSISHQCVFSTDLIYRKKKKT